MILSIFILTLIYVTQLIVCALFYLYLRSTILLCVCGLLQVRAKVVNFIRSFLDERGFLEVRAVFDGQAFSILSDRTAGRPELFLR